MSRKPWKTKLSRSKGVQIPLEEENNIEKVTEIVQGELSSQIIKRRIQDIHIIWVLHLPEYLLLVNV